MKISVVTVCRNAAATIGYALDSFCRQDHPDKELLVVDGASSDDTLKVVGAFGGEGLRVISEPDRGVYDAMNKGLRAFDGEAVGFLNADDRYYDRHALSAISDGLALADICFGDLDYVTSSGGRERTVRRWRSAAWRKGGFRAGWMPPHPTFYCRRHVVEYVGGFDLRYRLAADYDFMLRALELGGFSAAHAGRVLIAMGAGGVTSSRLSARIVHNLEALASRRRWLGAGVFDYALLAKPLRKASQFLPRAHNEGPRS